MGKTLENIIFCAGIAGAIGGTGTVAYDYASNDLTTLGAYGFGIIAASTIVSIIGSGLLPAWRKHIKEEYGNEFNISKGGYRILDPK